MNRVTQRVDEWKRKIVDLSRRNRSLYFVRTRGSTLRITEPGVYEVFERLVISEKPWEFFMPPDAPETTESEKGSGASELLLLERQAGEQPEDKVLPDRGADELVTDIKD